MGRAASPNNILTSISFIPSGIVIKLVIPAGGGAEYKRTIPLVERALYKIGLANKGVVI